MNWNENEIRMHETKKKKKLSCEPKPKCAVHIRIQYILWERERERCVCEQKKSKAKHMIRMNERILLIKKSKCHDNMLLNTATINILKLDNKIPILLFVYIPMHE